MTADGRDPGRISFGMSVHADEPNAAQPSDSKPRTKSIPRWVRSLAHDRLLQLLALIALGVGLYTRPRLADSWHWIDWPTITTLCGLLMLTKGIEISGALTRAGQMMIERLPRQRSLALALVGSAALLSMLLTNDVALFVVVPLTVALRRNARLPIGRLVIFEALAVNAGSLLTPIGNPQNILLWHGSKLSFASFIWQMAPLCALLLLLLLAATALAFKNEPIESAEQAAAPVDRRLFVLCGGLYAAFLVALALGHPNWAAAAVFVCLLLARPKVLAGVDWGLLVVFMLMFVDVHLVTDLAAIKPLVDQIAHFTAGQQFLAGIAWSQGVSNVPATILLLQYASASKLLAYAVNVGGFGLAIGSLANLIALRLAGERGLWWRFHLYSFPALALATPLAWWLL